MLVGNLVINEISFWKTEILDCFVIKTGKNPKGTRRSVQQRKCSLACLEGA